MYLFFQISTSSNPCSLPGLCSELVGGSLLSSSNTDAPRRFLFRYLSFLRNIILKTLSSVIGRSEIFIFVGRATNDVIDSESDCCACVSPDSVKKLPKTGAVYCCRLLARISGVSGRARKVIWRICDTFRMGNTSLFTIACIS